MNTGPRVAVSHSEPPPVRAVAPPAVLRWIRLGWTDLRRAGWPSLLHGLLVTVASLLIVEIALLFWPLLPGAVSGFLVVGPMLATGLYALSRRLEQGQRPRLRDALDAWRQGSRCLFRFGLLSMFTTFFFFNLLGYKPLQKYLGGMVPLSIGDFDQIINQACNLLLMGQRIFKDSQG